MVYSYALTETYDAEKEAFRSHMNAVQERLSKGDIVIVIGDLNVKIV